MKNGMFADYLVKTVFTNISQKNCLVQVESDTSKHHAFVTSEIKYILQ